MMRTYHTYVQLQGKSGKFYTITMYSLLKTLVWKTWMS